MNPEKTPQKNLRSDSITVNDSFKLGTALRSESVGNKASKKVSSRVP